MFGPLSRLLRQIVLSGDLTVIDARGRCHRFGDGSGSQVAVRLTERRLEW